MALLARNHSNRVLSGLASGIALRLGVEPVIVRAMFAVLAPVYGAGVMLYVLLCLLSTSVRSADIPRRMRTSRTNTGMSLIVLGGLIVADGLIDQTFVEIVIVLIAMATGVVLVWSRTDSLFSARRVFGVLLLFYGLANAPAKFHLQDGRFTPVLLVGIGSVLLLFAGAPLVLRLADQLQSERRARIRSEERSELSAQLHDSVLQTLTLIQRTQSVEQIHAIARVQERSLRDWMLGREQLDDSDLASVLRQRAADIEARHDVRIDVVVVGKANIDERVSLLLDAIHEAISNAARHSGSSQISVYVEVERDAITSSVRDEGSGFDVDTVAKERRGIRESIVGRMSRAGGAATFTSGSDGTEVEFHLPRGGGNA